MLNLPHSAKGHFPYLPVRWHLFLGGLLGPLTGITGAFTVVKLHPVNEFVTVLLFLAAGGGGTMLVNFVWDRMVPAACPQCQQRACPIIGPAVSTEEEQTYHYQYACPNCGYVHDTGVRYRQGAD